MKNYILIPLVILLFSACHKSDSQAPVLKPTQTGQNIIAFTVNGQQHTYTGVPSYFLPGITFSIMGSINSGMLIDMIGVAGKASPFQDAFEFVVNIPHFSLYQKYPVGNNYPYYQSQYQIKDANSQEHFYYPDSSKSWLTFTRLDSLVAAGTFEYYGIGNNGQTVILTDGFFDMAR
ncbi:MAG: hypothetical protein ACTHJ0_05720 [Flavipsychrobacter sp.]